MALPLSAFADSPHAKIGDLGWMSGYWSGAFGDQTLEEQWLPASSGSIAGVIRISDDDAMAMIELALIEESDDSLVLRVRQWLPGFVAASATPMTMKLVEIGERSVSFEAVGPAPLQRLSYSRPTEKDFHINAEAATGPFTIKLSRK